MSALKKKLILGAVQVAYASVVEPRKDNMNDNLKYVVTAKFPKDQIAIKEKLENHIQEMLRDTEVVKKLGEKIAGIRTPLRDGDSDKPDDPFYGGQYFFNASADTKHPPVVVNKDREPVTDKNEISSGCWVQLILEPYAYNRNGNRGIGLSLLGVRKISDGESRNSKISVNDFTDDLDYDVDADIDALI